MRARRVMFAVFLLGLAACTTTVSPSPSPTGPPVRVYNQTSVAVTLVVNGVQVAAIPAKSVLSPVTAAFPALPWAIQIESASGRSLLVLDVASGDLAVGLHGTASLACGLIELAVADQLPISEPAGSPRPGASPCD